MEVMTRPGQETPPILTEVMTRTGQEAPPFLRKFGNGCGERKRRHFYGSCVLHVDLSGIFTETET